MGTLVAIHGLLHLPAVLRRRPRVCYALVAELPAARLRSPPKTVRPRPQRLRHRRRRPEPLHENRTRAPAWNWKGKAGFFWAGTCSLCLAYCYFRLPEPAGRTYAELDTLSWLSAGLVRGKFKETKVDVILEETSEEATRKK
ncbi:hypothetical protein F4780DRAFT_307765 [Xylariomycetidae sp. FL0641]|nr:hypothetical protein F4780DRAFT_307765 [Xylariomycetidae sp. FL0641]